MQTKGKQLKITPVDGGVSVFLHAERRVRTVDYESVRIVKIFTQECVV